MKKIFNTILALLLVGSTFAQLPNGSTAPNFTAKDIDGKTWDLYDILDSGRPVILDISATWCPPCWSYHQGGVLEDIYAAHGPEGDATMMVLWVEGDGDTNEACIYGPSGCVGGTQGDWTAGTEFPIIDEASIFGKYQCTAYPTIFTIFPDTKTTFISGQASMAAHMTIAEPRIGDIKENAVIMSDIASKSLSQEICDAQEATPEVTLRNMGSEHLTSLKLELQWNGQTVQTQDWTGNAGVFDDISASFDALMIDGAGTLTVVASEPNGDATADTKTISTEYIAAPAVYTGSEVRMNILTDNQGAYLYWAAMDSDGNIIADGGNKAVGINGGGQYAGQAAPADAGAYGNFKNLNETIPVPADGGCFSVVIVDGAGDGFFGPGRYRLYNEGTNTPFFTLSEQFTTTIGKTFAPMSSGIDAPQAVESISAFPNPASSSMNVDFVLENAADIQMTVTNALGQTVQTLTSQVFAQGKHQVAVSVEDLPNGLYFLNLRSQNGGLTVQQFAVAK